MNDGIASLSGSKVRGVCIAGTQSDSGKTTVSLGIMAALRKRGLEVQPFKVGPDFIDPGHHRRITGRDSHNLDGWMLDRKANQGIFNRYAGHVDASVVEGVMGLFDGFSGNDESGSTAQMAKWLDIPAALVIDAHAMARSAAAAALGFSVYDPELELHGIIFNRVAGRAHARAIAEAMNPLTDLPVLGFLPSEQGLEIPSRHLGLLTEEEHGLEAHQIERLAAWAEENLDLERLLEATCPMPAEPPRTREPAGRKVLIGIARDEAFCFYYAENLRRLKEAGAELAFFSPIRDQRLPEGCDGLVLGGGYPEVHAAALSGNRDMRGEIRRFGMQGKPIYAECGGFMYLMEAMRDLQGAVHPMVGLFPMTSHMETGMMSLGYREIVTIEDSIIGPSGTRVRGHEFHYSQIASGKEKTRGVYSVTDGRRAIKGGEGFLAKRVLGSYMHQHWGSNPEVPRSLVKSCGS